MHFISVGNIAEEGVTKRRMSNMRSQLWHGYSHVPKRLKDAILVMEKEILCVGRHVVFNELEHSCIDVLLIYSVCSIFVMFPLCVH